VSEEHTKEFVERRRRLWEQQHKCRTPSGFEGRCIAPFLHCPPHPDNNFPDNNFKVLEALTFYMKDKKNPFCSLFIDEKPFVSHYNPTLPRSRYEVKSKVAIKKGQVITYVVGKLMIDGPEEEIKHYPWPIYTCNQENGERIRISTSPVVYDSGFYSAYIHRNQVNKIKDKIAQFKAEPNYSRFFKSTSNGEKANAFAFMNGNGNCNIEIRAIRNIEPGEVISLVNQDSPEIREYGTTLTRNHNEIQRCYDAAIMCIPICLEKDSLEDDGSTNSNKKNDVSVASKKDDVSVASSISATLERIEKRLESIECLDLGARLTVLESSLKKPVDTPKPRDRTQYDSDTEDSEES
jgi:hypothetical protein